MTTTKKPKVKLLGKDGNAFIILAECKAAARNAGMSQEEITKILDEMMDGDYDNLLAVACKYFEVS